MADEKKPEKKPKTPLDMLRAAAKGVNKQYGSRTLVMGAKPMAIPRIPTGSISLDFATGGGIPIGRTTIFVGGESSGKTTNAKRVIANAQSLCRNCYRRATIEGVDAVPDEETGEVFYLARGKCDCVAKGIFKPVQLDDEKDAEFAERCERYKANSYEEFRVAFFDQEGTFDWNWAKKIGVDTNRLTYVRTETAQECLDVYSSVMQTGAIDLMVLDSIAALAPNEEIEESFEKWQQGLQARLMNKFSRTSQAQSNAVARDRIAPITHIWINQWREKIGMLFGDNRVMPGGKGQVFAASVIVDFWAKKPETSDVEGLTKDEGMSVADTVRLCFKGKKNKTAPSQGEGSYIMWVRGQNAGKVDETDLLIQLAEQHEQLRKDGSKWFLGKKEFRTKGDAVAYLDMDIRERDRLRIFLLQKILEG